MSVAPPGRGLHDRFVDVVAQWVQTSWTKRSRGGSTAAVRNVAPVGFALPVRRYPVVHKVLMDEAHEFEPSESFRDGQPDRSGVLRRSTAGRVNGHAVGDASPLAPAAGGVARAR